MKLLVTGASGFVGQAVLFLFNSMRGVTAIGSVRRAAMFADANAPLVTLGELTA